jgi:hypothetical protein
MVLTPVIFTKWNIWLMNSLVAVHPEWVLIEAIGLAANRQPVNGAISKKPRQRLTQTGTGSL